MKLVDINIVFNFWGDVAESVWDDNEKVINGMRKDIGTPFTFQYWEFLVKEFKKRKIAISKNNSYKARGPFIAHHNKERDSLDLRI
jgi:hypothetical protein